MTRWGALLLVIYLILGLSRTQRSKAVTLAVGFTTLVIAAVMVKTVR
jgi:hypothetical protein